MYTKNLFIDDNLEDLSNQDSEIKKKKKKDNEMMIIGQI